MQAFDNNSMYQTPSAGAAIELIPNRRDNILLSKAFYTNLLNIMQAEYPDAPDICGMVLGWKPESTITTAGGGQNNNGARHFIVKDYGQNSEGADKVREGTVLTNVRTPNQVYVVVLTAASPDPVFPADVMSVQVFIDTSKNMFTTETGTGIISSNYLYFIPFGDGSATKVDQYGRKIALVEVF